MKHFTILNRQGLLTRSYGKAVPISKILIENKASGTQLIQDLKADGVHAVTAYQPPTGTDKIMRLHAQTAASRTAGCCCPREHRGWRTMSPS